LIAKDEFGNLNGRVELRIVERALAAGVERDDAGCVDASGLERVELAEVNSLELSCAL
jgi:hypothetical protein